MTEKKRKERRRLDGEEERGEEEDRYTEEAGRWGEGAGLRTPGMTTCKGVRHQVIQCGHDVEREGGEEREREREREEGVGRLGGGGGGAGHIWHDCMQESKTRSSTVWSRCQITGCFVETSHSVHWDIFSSFSKFQGQRDLSPSCLSIESATPRGLKP